MDSNFEGTNMEQWQEIENSPFEEMDELPISAADDEEPEDNMMQTDDDVEEAAIESAAEYPAESSADEGAAKKKAEEQEEERKRAEHEASEAKRKAEWEAKQQEKKEAELREIYLLDCMSDEDAMVASMQRISKDTEKLTRRNMKDCVSEHVQTLCLEDAAFARLTMYPRKSMINCFRYINRKAKEFVEQEMKDNDIKPQNCNGVYGSDIPDDLCYQWAEDYVYDPDAPEDKPEEEEKFEPRPYRGKSVSKKDKKKVEVKKSTAKKVPVKTDDKNIVNSDASKAEESLTGQMSLLDYLTPDNSITQKAS